MRQNLGWAVGYNAVALPIVASASNARSGWCCARSSSLAEPAHTCCARPADGPPLSVPVREGGVGVRQR
ncbi:MAG TPA: hypothetical protein VF065_03295, partial [Ilumatobacter sp.]